MSAQLSRVRRPDFERDLLTQLAARWGRRAVIKQDELDLDGHYDPDLPDFPENLAPVLALPGAGSLDDEARGQILAAAWICYNAKTAAVEDCASWISTRTAGRWCEGWTSAWPAWPARPVT